MNREQEHSILISLIFQLTKSVSGKDIPAGEHWRNDAHVLSEKIFKHLVSAHNLSKGSSFQDSKGDEYSFIDHSSIAVIIRSAFESYLVFYFLYLNQDKQVSAYRHKTWILAGLIDRGRMFAGSHEAKAQQEHESTMIEDLKQEIQQDPIFVLEPNKAKILKGEWRGTNAWHDLAVNAGFHRTYFKDIYKHLCGHSHSSFISALQTRDANDLQSQNFLSKATIQIGTLLMAHLSFAYASYFKEADEILKSNKKAFQIADKWNIKAKDQNPIYGVSD